MPHHLGLAAVLLGVAAVLTWLLVVLTGHLVAWAGWVLVPYAVWLTVATSLAVGYWRLVAPARPPAEKFSGVGASTRARVAEVQVRSQRRDHTPP